MQNILKWDIIRILRFSIGVFFIAQAFAEQNIWTGLFGVLFAAMAIFNIGCCAGGACNTTSNKSKNESNEIIYEEVHSK